MTIDVLSIGAFPEATNAPVETPTAIGRPMIDNLSAHVVGRTLLTPVR